MISLKEKAYDATLQLHSSIFDIRDYTDFPVALESIIKKVFHIDWLCIGSLKGANDYSIVSNPYLPFDWGQKYSEIFDYDKVRKDTLKLKVGEALIYDKESCRDPGQKYACEVVKKHTDTSQFLTLHAAQTGSFNAVIGFYRADQKNCFQQEDKIFIEHLSPVLASISQMINVYKEFDFQRVIVDELRRSKNDLSLVLNNRFEPIDIPRNTERFLRKYFHFSSTSPLPDFIHTWIQSTIAPQGTLLINTGPWLLKQNVPQLEVYCRAYSVFTRLNQLVLLIQFIPHGGSVDFSLLQKAGLTKRETETLSFLPLGYTNSQIALAMGIEEVTVKKHLKNSSDKLDTSGRTELLYQALQTKNLLESLKEIPPPL